MPFARQQIEPDLVDRIFEYIVRELPHEAERVAPLREVVRQEFAGEVVRIPSRSAIERRQTASEVLRLFNGRNATEVARRLQISRSTVYRIIKQPGRAI